MSRWGSIAVVGRFQPFHWGHFEYVAEAALLADELIIGIANPTRDATRQVSSDVVRARDDANPFSYEVRCSMIDGALQRYLPHVKLRFVPCDLRSAAAVRATLGDCDAVALTVYDAWGEEKQGLLEEAGYVVRVLWRRTEKMVRARDVRERLQAGLSWEHLVPRGSVDLVRAHFPPRAVG